MVLPALVYRADAREAVAHYRMVASASALPIMIYNNPVSYGVDLTPELLGSLGDEPRFVAIKESSNDIRRIADPVALTGDRYVLFACVDDLAVESVLLGARGYVAGMVNVFPRGGRAILRSRARGTLRRRDAHLPVADAPRAHVRFVR